MSWPTSGHGQPRHAAVKMQVYLLASPRASKSFMNTECYILLFAICELAPLPVRSGAIRSLLISRRRETDPAAGLFEAFLDCVRAVLKIQVFLMLKSASGSKDFSQFKKFFCRLLS